jgi:hypothetical protein
MNSGTIPKTSATVVKCKWVQYFSILVMAQYGNKLQTKALLLAHSYGFEYFYGFLAGDISISQRMKHHCCYSRPKKYHPQKILPMMQLWP